MVKDMLSARGFETKILPTEGAPVVYAERKGKRDKTLLFYNHYDVQPAEPLELWDSPPFQPRLEDGKLFARGVSDDKGQLVNRIFAIDAILNYNGDLPCSIKFVIEGEEEVGSVHLPDFIKNNTQLLKADACIWEFGGVDHREIPMQYLGLRGICYVELSTTTAKQDVHSGLGGSIFPNSAWRLVWALNTLKDQNEHINLPGHYDKVLQPSNRDIELLESLPEVADEYRQRYGVDHFLRGIQSGIELHIAEVFEPTCTICGLTSGYQGDGSKTIIPAQASAKIDFRLVPEQTPDDVLTALRKHLDQEGFPDVNIRYLGGGPAARTDPDDPFVALVVESAAPVYGRPMQIVPITGGSGPNYAFRQYLNIPICTAGIGYPGSNVHAPNENIRLDLYLKGAKHITRIIDAFADL
jgi:acetylornithine deacetylase/succinyl-diaminopimelate desuccinylase-like protein